MPFQRSRYPKDWPAISLAVKERAGWRCENCGVAHGADAISAKGKPYKVVLTTAHTDFNGANRHDKSDLRGLFAWCQKCHLRYDHADHVRHAAATRARKKAQLQPVLDLFASDLFTLETTP